MLDFYEKSGYARLERANEPSVTLQPLRLLQNLLITREKSKAQSTTLPSDNVLHRHPGFSQFGRHEPT